MLIALGVLSLLLIVVLAVLLARARRKRTRMESMLDSITGQLEHLQRSFQRFVPQDVVEDIINRGVATRGERREVTIMFADLVGFTRMSEQSDPATVVEMLNGYFQAATRAIAQHNGYVSKFMGDGLLAVFGAPEPNPWQAADGVRAALAMRAAMGRYNQTLAQRGLPPLAVSIGLHRGPVIAGVIGSMELVEYTVIGDTVNTASRIEGLTRGHSTDILISETVRERLDERFVLEEKPAVPVKGKAETVTTWAVVSYDG